MGKSLGNRGNKVVEMEETTGKQEVTAEIRKNCGNQILNVSKQLTVIVIIFQASQNFVDAEKTFLLHSHHYISDIPTKRANTGEKYQTIEI